MSQAVTNKRRGFSFEREVVHTFKDAGYNAKRAYASNGLSLGREADVDILVTELNLAIQCKRRKKLPKYLDLGGSADATIFREDRGQQYILMDLQTFIKFTR